MPNHINLKLPKQLTMKEEDNLAFMGVVITYTEYYFKVSVYLKPTFTRQ